jgi:hypothetical protein
VGVASAMAQQPYLGVGHTRMLYPYLSSVQDSTLTRKCLCPPMPCRIQYRAIASAVGPATA